MATSLSNSYKLGQEIANGVKFFGGYNIKNGQARAKCICPTCGEIWEALISKVKSGDIKQCISCKGRQNANARWDKEKGNK